VPGEREGPGASSESDRARLARLLAERSFRVGRFELSSGRTSDYYVDCRTTTMHGEGQVLVGRLGWEAVSALRPPPERIGGMTMGADPISYAVAGEAWRRGRELHAFSVRKSAKRHGAGRRIEGCFAEGDRVVVAEDVITTGGSALEAAAVVEAAGGEVAAILALVDREEGGRETIEGEGRRVLSLFTVEDLRRAAPA